MAREEETNDSEEGRFPPPWPYRTQTKLFAGAAGRPLSTGPAPKNCARNMGVLSHQAAQQRYRVIS